MNLVGIIKTDKNVPTNQNSSEIVEDFDFNKNFNKIDDADLFNDLKKNSKNYKQLEIDFDNNKAKSFDYANIIHNTPIRKNFLLSNEEDKILKPFLLKRQKSLPNNTNYNIYSGLIEGIFFLK